MAADLSSPLRVVSKYEDEDEAAGEEAVGSKSRVLITRDFLGDMCDSQELDLDLQVPLGWEKRLDLKSGKVYLQRCSSTSSSTDQTNQTTSKPLGVSSPPSPSKIALSLFDEGSLELKLVSSSPKSPSSSRRQSACAPDKVKGAVERAERKRWWLWNSSSGEEEDERAASSVAVRCPGCLSYVLIMKTNPKCPRCNSLLPSPLLKKPRLDLNISI